MFILKEKILKMLDIKINEAFYLKYIHEKNHDTTFLFRITDNLHIESKFNRNNDYSEYTWENSNIELGDLLSGKYKIIKKTSKLKKGDHYYYISFDFENEKDIINKKIKIKTWDNTFLEKTLLVVGNIFNTEEEAYEHMDEIINKYLEVYAKV